MAISHEQKMGVAIRFVTQPRPYINRGNFIDAHLCDFQGGHLGFKFSERGGSKPGLGIYVGGHRQELENTFAQVTIPSGFELNTQQQHVGQNDNGWIAFCKHDCATQNDIYTDIVEPGAGLNQWRQLFNILRQKMAEMFEDVTNNGDIQEGNNLPLTMAVPELIADQGGEEGEDDEDGDADQTGSNIIKELALSNLQVILTGAPGTGKTYTARKVAEELVCDGIENEAEKAVAERDHIASVQFHPGYDYSDFVIGMKPRLVGAEGNQQVTFEWRPGVFKEFADAAKADLDHKYVFLIDEINRADLSRVFGEMFSLLEEDYRYCRDGGVERNVTGIQLPNGENFVIPKNLYIIGTMNDIDRSVESMDFALRRRFAWYEVPAEESESIIDEKVHDQESCVRLKRAMSALNSKIADPDFRLGSEYQLGGAIFAKYVKYIGEVNPFDNLWKRHIEIILREYLRGRRTKENDLNELKGIYEQSVRQPLQRQNPQQPEDPQPRVQQQ